MLKFSFVRTKGINFFKHNIFIRIYMNKAKHSTQRIKICALKINLSVILYTNNLFSKYKKLSFPIVRLKKLYSVINCVQYLRFKFSLLNTEYLLC